jgi:hypothetical protein
MNTNTPADGSYSYQAGVYGARYFARFEGGTLAHLTREGEAQAVSALTAAHVAADLARVPFAFAPLAQPIGKARAAKLHRLMARAGVPSGEHYGFASDALGQPVYSLAALYPVEARAVWRFLTATHSAAA